MSRNALFDLAVNRALSYGKSLGLLDREPEALRTGLEPWYLKTRFAYRVPLQEVLETLDSYPGEGYYWHGGQLGGWCRGDNPRP